MHTCSTSLLQLLAINPMKMFSSFLFIDTAGCVHAQSYPTLCDHTDCSLPGSSVLGIFQGRIPEWVVISSSRGYLPDPGIKLASFESLALQADSLPLEALGNPN